MVVRGAFKTFIRVRAALVSVALANSAICACQTTPLPQHPPFFGRASRAWLAYDAVNPDRDPNELLAAFLQSAQRYGCTTEEMGRVTFLVPRDLYELNDEAARYRTGVIASCAHAVAHAGTCLVREAHHARTLR
jgi:hypothetical protein